MNIELMVWGFNENAINFYKNLVLSKKSNNYVEEFDKVVVYYDNGQEALGAIIDTLLINKTNVERRIEFDHKEKRLFQVSDMLTFVDKIVYKFIDILLFLIYVK